MPLSNQPTGTREAAAERRVRALELRQKGNSYRAIARQLGVSEAQAHKDVHASLRALAEQEMSTAEELRALELERLDALLLIVSDEVEQGNLAAVDRALRIGERRAKLLGLDAPQRMDTTITLDVRTLSDDDLDALADGRPLALLEGTGGTGAA